MLIEPKIATQMGLGSQALDSIVVKDSSQQKRNYSEYSGQA